MSFLAFFFRPAPGDAPRATLLLRVAAGIVFVVSGVMKFAYANHGVGRFTKIGLPSPEILAPFVGGVEIAGGALLLLGLFTRPAAAALVVDMMVAIATTKVPLILGAGPEPVHAPPETGILAFLFQARLDITMLLTCAFLVWAGPGRASLDAKIARGR